jgi:hypothetical protein
MRRLEKRSAFRHFRRCTVIIIEALSRGIVGIFGLGIGLALVEGALAFPPHINQKNPMRRLEKRSAFRHFRRCGGIII